MRGAVPPEEEPEYWRVVTCPCDLSTILARVDGRAYGTAAAYLAHVALIEKVWGLKGLNGRYFRDTLGRARGAD